MKVKLIILCLICGCYAFSVKAAFLDDGGSYTIGDAIPGDDSTLLTISGFFDGVTVDSNVDNMPGTHVNITDPAYFGYVSLRNHSTATDFGGLIEEVYLKGNSSFVMEGGGINWLSMADYSTLTLNEGVIAEQGGMYDISDNAQIYVNGGNINHGGDLRLKGNSVLTINEGNVETAVFANGDSAIHVYGGSLWCLIAEENGEIRITGKEFQLNGIDVDFGAFDIDYLRSIGALDRSNNGRLTGYYLDDSPIDVSLTVSRYGDGTANFVLVPEPGAVILLSFGVIGVLKRKRLK